MSNQNVTMMSELVEANGKTIRENNMSLQHNIPLGSLVEVKFDDWHGGGACAKVHARMWVSICGRDCDGTPLYWLTRETPDAIREIVEFYTGRPAPDDLIKLPFEHKRFFRFHGGFDEKDLTVIEITDAVKRGEGALEWGENDG